MSKKQKEKDAQVKPIVMCTCYSEGFMVEVDNFDDSNPDNKMVSLSVMQRYGEVPHNWKNRIRLAWKILRTGIPYGDQVVLDVEKTKSLINLLEDAIKK